MSIGSTRLYLTPCGSPAPTWLTGLMKDYGFERYEAVHLPGRRSPHIANVVDPQFSVACALNKKYLPK
jgi:hypothetical protein